MKKTLVKTALFMLLASMILPAQAFADAFGPEEWTQYRMNSHNNPIYEGSPENPINQTLKTGDEVRATPVVVGNRVYVGNHNSGDLFAFDVNTGEQIWKSKAPNWIHSEMIYNDGRLFVGYGNRFFQENGNRGTEDSGLLALDAETGETLWDFKTEGEVMPTPAIYKENVYIAAGDKQVHAINMETGEESWKVDLGNVVSMSSPNIHDGILYVGTGQPRPYRFTAVDLEEQKILWQTEFPDVVAGLDDVPPVVYDNRFVITTALEFAKKESARTGGSTNFLADNRVSAAEMAQMDHLMYALDIKTGEIAWQKSLGTGTNVENNKSGAPIIYEDQIFVGSPITKKFYSYEAETGEQIWSYDTNVNKGAPVAADGKVYFGDVKGLVYAFDTTSGELVGKKELSGKLAPAGPVLISNHLVVGSQDSNVYIFPVDSLLGSDSAAGDEKAAPETDSGQENATDTETAGAESGNGNMIWIFAAAALGAGALLFIFFRRNRAE